MFVVSEISLKGMNKCQWSIDNKFWVLFQLTLSFKTLFVVFFSVRSAFIRLASS